MGHGSDKLYITHDEHTAGAHSASSTGARAKKSMSSFQRLPYNACALSLKTVETPVCTVDGTLYELLAIIPWLREHGTNPVTGRPLAAGDLIKVNFFYNSDGHEHDPVTYKVFNEHTALVMIKTTGNIYSRETIDLLNIKAKHMKDLMTEVPFTKADIITLQDPLNVQARDFSKFDHILKAIPVPSSASVPEKKVKNPNAAPQVATTVSTKTVKPVLAYNSSLISSNRTAASLTSTSAPIQQTVENALWNEEDLMFEQVQARGEKAFARLVTNFGNINLELYCDKAPRTCYNFLQLAREDKYKDTIFHRLIPGFMLQGGDPTGTGRGGTSWWGSAFDDEYSLRGAHKHEARGTLAMANSGPNTNGSQFYLTFRPTDHLDGKHTVFGRIVGGMDVLDKIERVPVDPSTNRPLKPVRLTDVAIFADPYDAYQKRLEKRLAKEAESRDGASARALQAEAREADRTTWFGVDLERVAQSELEKGAGGKGGVGKYLGTEKEKGKVGEKRKAGVEGEIGGHLEEKKSKKKGGFGEFSGW